MMRTRVRCIDIFGHLCLFCSRLNAEAETTVGLRKFFLFTVVYRLQQRLD